MTYFPVDDDMAFHPKVLAAGNEAIGMWVRAGALCKKYTTGGFVSDETARSLGAKRVANLLVTAGLWDVVDGGYLFHDWSHQAGNDDATVEKERRDQERERWRQRKQAQRARERDSHGVTPGVTSGVTPPVTPGTPSPSPSPRDFYTPSESQSLPTRARLSTDAIPVSAMTKRLAGQQGVTNLRAVVDAVAAHCQVRITADQAYQLSVHILGKRQTPPDAPQRYVLGAIEKSPAEIQQHIYESMEVA